MMHMNRTSERKVMAIWISREVLLLKFERLDILSASIILSSQKLWPFRFAESFIFQFQGSRYIMRMNRTSELKVIAIWISPEFPLYNFERLDISWASIIHWSEKLCSFLFVECFRVQFCGSRYMMHVNRSSEWKLIAAWIFWELRCSIFSVSIYHGRDHTFESKVFAIWIWWELPNSI